MQILRKATAFLHARQILLALQVQKVLLALVVSGEIERRAKLAVFDCVMHLLRDHENAGLLLAENALSIFTGLLGPGRLSAEETVQCLRSG